MGAVPAAILAAGVATTVLALIYVVQCALFPVVYKDGTKRIRVGRLVVEHVLDNYRQDQPVTRKD